MELAVESLSVDDGKLQKFVSKYMDWVNPIAFKRETINQMHIRHQDVRIIKFSMITNNESERCMRLLLGNEITKVWEIAPISQ